jgi:hypothetical protein
METRIGTGKNTCETNDKNQIETQFMSSQVFHQTPYERVQETTVRERLKLQSLELFDPIVQDKISFYPTTIFTK